MIDSALELALGNVPVSIALAALAYAVHRHGRFPALAHLLWVVVLIKVITPSLLVLSVPLGAPAVMSQDVLASEVAVLGSAAVAPSLLGQAVSLVGSIGPAMLVLAWVLGSAIAVLASVRRMRDFGRLLAATSSRAPRPVEHLAASVGYELGLHSVPPVMVTRARVSPMSWWSRGRIRLVLPASLLQRSDHAELRWVLAHELAHVRRRDHLVRWIEWLASVAFWWNPVVWIARRYLRLDEEDACDALVLEHIEGAPRAYAGALLDAVEVLSQPRGPVPAMATGIDAARSLERRIRAIVSPQARRRAPRPLIGGLVALAVMGLTIGFGPASAPGEPAGPELASLPAPTAGSVATDTSESSTVRYATVSATVGAKVYDGTAGGDVYDGTMDDETISGFAGADELGGGGGRDTIRGGAGADIIRGGAGRDELHGGAGADIIRGGAGRDVIEAGAGNDTVYTWTDGTPDRIDCGDGKDRAVIDSTDTARSCEDVIVRDPA